MSDKAFYTEQPAFETNEFEGSQLVRIYQEDRVYDKKVHAIQGEYLIFNLDFPTEFRKHFKQCRLLKKREPREWWIYPVGHTWGVTESSSTTISGSIKVREVLE